MSRWLILFVSCLPVFAMAAEPVPLGRLFLTPAERAALDTIRQNSRPPEKIVTPGNASEEDETAASPTAPPVVTVQGYVKRSDGKGTVWINGQAVQEKSATKDVEVGRLQGNTNEVQIKLPGAGQTIKLKAGQSYNPASGKVGNLREVLPQTSSTLLEPAADDVSKDMAKTKSPTDKAASTMPPLPPASR